MTILNKKRLAKHETKTMSHYSQHHFITQYISDCEYSLSIGPLKLGSPTFADDMTLLSLFPSFLQLLMKKAFGYSQKWRFDYN